MSRELTERLSAYLDGELRPAERQALERELASSPELERRLAELRGVVEMMRGAPREEVPEELFQHVQRALRFEPELRGLRAKIEARRARYSRLDWRLLLALLATILALAVAGIYVAYEHQDDSPTVIFVPSPPPDP
jgi:anti-sigma factor RsiW